MEVKVQAHVAYQTRYHVVWIPKYRRKVLVEGVKEYLEKTIQTIVIDRYPDVYVISFLFWSTTIEAIRVSESNCEGVCGIIWFWNLL